MNEALAGESLKVVGYYDRWLTSYDKPGKLISSEQAERRHLEGKRYCALTEGASGKVSVECTGEAGVVKVLFFDSADHWTTRYTFTASADDKTKLWLEQTTRRQYLDERRYRYEILTVSRSGLVHAERGFSALASLAVTNQESGDDQLDPASLEYLKEPFPAFGEYGSIARFDRE